jgi:hypothetical protein
MVAFLQVMRLTCYFLSLRSKYSPQHPVFKHSQSAVDTASYNNLRYTFILSSLETFFKTILQSTCGRYAPARFCSAKLLHNLDTRKKYPRKLTAASVTAVTWCCLMMMYELLTLCNIERDYFTNTIHTGSVKDQLRIIMVDYKVIL